MFNRKIICVYNFYPPKQCTLNISFVYGCVGGGEGRWGFVHEFLSQNPMRQGKKKYFKSLLKFSKKLTNVVRARGISTWISITKPNASRGKKIFKKVDNLRQGEGDLYTYFYHKTQCVKGKKNLQIIVKISQKVDKRRQVKNIPY